MRMIDRPSTRGWILSVVVAGCAWGGITNKAGRPESDGQTASVRDGNDVASATASPVTSSRQRTTGGIREAYGKLPLSFELNNGQTDARVKFISRGPGYTLFLRATEAVLALRQGGRPEAGNRTDQDDRNGLRSRQARSKAQNVALRMRFVNGNPQAQGTGREELPGRVNYFVGDDPKRWHRNLPTYARVNFEDVYPGIDLVYYGNQRQLEYDFIVAPYADPTAIALAFDGVDTVNIDGQGNLILHNLGGKVTQRAPLVYQEIDGVKRYIPSRYALHRPEAKRSLFLTDPDKRDSDVVRFQVGDYDRRWPLVIDPVLVYSTYLGGGNEDTARSIAVDSDGSAYVTGTTTSRGFPTTPGSFDTTFGGGEDIFITKLDGSGAALIYSTYLGGSSYEAASAISVDSAGNAYVTGYTTSTDFPTTAGAFKETSPGGDNAFVTKLATSGDALAYSTYLGGNGIDLGSGIRVDSSGNAYVTGYTQSSDFPTTPAAFDTTLALGGGFDIFVTKLAATGGHLVYSTYLGGGGNDHSSGIAVDSSDAAYVTGATFSTDFPITSGAFDDTFRGGSYGFVTKLAASGEALAYSTYLGGNGDNRLSDIAVDGAGNAYVTGGTNARDFPTTPGAFDTALALVGLFDAFVTKIHASGMSLVYSTYLGGSGNESGAAIAVDAAGTAVITGGTQSSDFPMTPAAFDVTFGGDTDGFVTALSATGASLGYSTYLGGAGLDGGTGIVADNARSIYVTGITHSSDFPTTPAAFDTTLSGGSRDAFVLKIGGLEPSLADLVETAVSNPPASAVLKQKFLVSDSTSNQAEEPAVPTTTRYYLSLDTLRSASDKLLAGKRAVPALDGGVASTGTVNVTVPPSSRVGVYYLLACADDLQVQVESNEGNNCRASSTTVEVRGPDLVETAVSDPPATATLGGSFSVTDTVANAGNASAGASTTRYYFSLDVKKSVKDHLLGGLRAVPDLVVGAASTDSVTVTIPATLAPTAYYLLACGDDLKKVAESDETNNCRASATTVTISP